MKKNNQERGVALLFAIGIVGLMMMLLVTYATVSMTNRDVATNSTAQYSARLLAESCYTKVKKLLDSQVETPDTYVNLINLRSKGEKQTAGDDNLKKLLSTIRNSLISESENDDMYLVIQNSFDQPNTDKRPPNWQLVYDTNGKIVARFAYTTYRPLGLLDPLKMNDSGNDIPKTIKYKINKKNITNTPYTDTTFPTDNETQRPYTWFDSLFAKTTNSQFYDTWPNLLVDTTKTDSQISELKKEKDKWSNSIINQIFKSPASPYSGEYFWYSKDGTAENAKRYYRFNLNRTDWNTLTVDELLKKDNLKEYNQEDKDSNTSYIPGKPETGKDGDTKCIPWLAYGSLPEQQRQQIAANLIAFMATVMEQEDSISESVINENNDYFGNLRAPYLSEIGSNVRLSLTETGEPDPDIPNSEYEYTITAEVYVFVELCNFFKKLIYYEDSEQTKTCSRKYKVVNIFNTFKITYTIPKSDQEQKNDSDQEQKDTIEEIDFNPNLKELEGDDYRFEMDNRHHLILGKMTETAADDGKSYKYSYALPLKYMITKTFKSKKRISSLKSKLELVPGKVMIKRMKPKPNESTVMRTEDVCNLSSLGISIERDLTVNNSPLSIWRSWQVVDPRNNQHVSQTVNGSTVTNWSVSPNATNDDGMQGNLSMTISFNDKNELLETTAGENNDPTDESEKSINNYYREMFEFPDKTIFHPGMLGYINRGENFKTLNLGVFENKTTTSNNELFYKTETGKHGFYINGINKYEYGDAPLWDQLRWTDENVGYEFGKININGIVREYKKNNITLDPRDNRDAAAALFKNTGLPELGSAARDNDYFSTETILAWNNKTEIGESPSKQFEERISILYEGTFEKIDTDGKVIHKKNTGEKKYTKGNETETIKQWLLKTENGSKKSKKDFEEALGKFMLMTTAGPAPFEADDTVYVLCVAQVVKDLGSFSGTKILYRDKDGKWQIHTAEAGKWDKDDDGIDIDQVLATQRVFVILQKNNLGKWKIMRVEYVD